MSKKFNKAVASTVACLVVSSVVQMPAFAASTTTTLGGSSRIDTAIKIAEASWTGAWKDSKTAVLTASADENLADALAVAPLAFQEKAPILLTEAGDKVNADVLKELKDRKVTKVYLTAGTGVLKAGMEAQLKAEGFTVERLGGKDRFETAQNIGAKLTKVEAVAVVNAYATIDALSVAAMAAANNMQIVMTEADVTPTVKAGVPVYVVGGEGVVTKKVADELKATRLGDKTRYTTNAATIKGLDKMVDYKTVYVADGSDKGVDALAGSVLAAQTKSPIFIADKDGSLVKEQTDLLTEHKAKDSNVIRLGAQTALESTVKTITGANTPSATGVTVTAMGAKKLQVKFDGAVDDTKAILELKRESSVIKIAKTTYSEDKKSAIIETEGKLIAATYTLKVTGLSKDMSSTVDVKDEKVNEIKITTQTAPLIDDSALDAEVRFSVLNQYGEDITKIYGNNVRWTSTAGAANNGIGVAELSKGKFNVHTEVTNKFVPGKEVFLSGVYTDSSTGNTATISGKVTVGLKAVADDVTISKVYSIDKEFNTENFTAVKSNGQLVNDFMLVYQVKDQYGNIMEVNAAPEVQFINNNPLLLKLENDGRAVNNTVEIAGVKYYTLKVTPESSNNGATGTHKGGTGIIQAISTRTGKKSELKVELKALTEIKSFKMSSPGTIAAAMEDIEIPFTAMDDQGKEIREYDKLIDANLSFSDSVNMYFEKQDDGTAKLMFQTGSKRLAVISVTKATAGIVNTLTVDVKDQAVAMYVDGLKPDVDTAAVKERTTLEYKWNDFKVMDQYGRVMSDANLSGWLNDSQNKIVVTAGSKFDLENAQLVDSQRIKEITNTYDRSTYSVVLTPNSNLGVDTLKAHLVGKGVDGSVDGAKPSASKVEFKIENVATDYVFRKYTVADVKDVLLDRTQDLNVQIGLTTNVKVTVKGSTINGYTINIGKKFPNSVKLVLSNATDNLSKLSVAPTGNVINYTYNKDHFKAAADFTEKVTVLVYDGNNVEQLRDVKDVKVTTKKNVASVIESKDIREDGRAHASLIGGQITADTLKSFVDIKDQRGTVQDSYKVPAVITISNIKPATTTTTPVVNNTTNVGYISNLVNGDRFTATFTLDGVKTLIDVIAVTLDNSALDTEEKLSSALTSGKTDLVYIGDELTGDITIGENQIVTLNPSAGVTLYGAIENKGSLIVNAGDTLTLNAKSSITNSGTVTIGASAAVVVPSTATFKNNRIMPITTGVTGLVDNAATTVFEASLSSIDTVEKVNAMLSDSDKAAYLQIKGGNTTYMALTSAVKSQLQQAILVGSMTRAGIKASYDAELAKASTQVTTKQDFKAFNNLALDATSGITAVIVTGNVIFNENIISKLNVTIASNAKITVATDRILTMTGKTLTGAGTLTLAANANVIGADLYASNAKLPETSTARAGKTYVWSATAIVEIPAGVNPLVPAVPGWLAQ